jgi:hypothetical protein
MLYVIYDICVWRVGREEGERVEREDARDGRGL